MKTAIVTALLILAPIHAFAFSTVDEFADDFAKARECRPIDGRKVWAGEKAYYVQNWLFRTGDSGLLDENTAAAVPVSDNTDDALAPFKKACQ